MTASSLFESRDYKAFLKRALDLREAQGRGQRSLLAKAAKCHTAYVSQVLNGPAHFSLEQADRINRFLGHSPSESNFFLTLIQFNRAGTPTLRQHFQEQLQILAEKQLNLRDRLQATSRLSEEDHVKFYSSWHNAAVHVLVSVPGCNTAEGISRYLGLPLSVVQDTLAYLESVGLVTRTKGLQYGIGKSHLHLDASSPMISRHHTNWRLQALRSLEVPRASDLHYSSVITASVEDSIRIREVLVKAIEQIRPIVRASKDEGAFSYCLDFFGLDRRPE